MKKSFKTNSFTLPIVSFLLKCTIFSTIYAANFPSALDLEDEVIKFVRAAAQEAYSSIPRESFAELVRTNPPLESRDMLAGYQYRRYRMFEREGQQTVDHTASIFHSTISNRDLILVAFRGSNTHRDWGYNLSFGRVDAINFFGGVSIHHGFNVRYGSFQKFRNPNEWSGPMNVLDNLKFALETWEIDPSCAQIIFTGHSAGAALSTLAAFHFGCNRQQQPEDPVFQKVNHSNQVILVTFSSPKVGDEQFVEKLHLYLNYCNILRFFCDADRVPFTPPGNYAHAGIAVNYSLNQMSWIVDEDRQPTNDSLLTPLLNAGRFLAGAYTLLTSGPWGHAEVIVSRSIFAHSIPSQALILQRFLRTQTRSKDEGVVLSEAGLNV